MRQHAEHNYGLPTFGVKALWTLSQNYVCLVTWKPFEIFLWTFTEMLTTMRQYVEHKNHNWFTYFWSYGPLNTVCLSLNPDCPVT